MELNTAWTKLVEWVTTKLFKSKKVKKEITESDIMNHDIFNYIDFWSNSKIPTLKFSTEYRTVVFKKYMTILLRSYKSEISTFINKKEFEEWDENELWKNLLHLINSSVSVYEKEMIDSGIPKVVIDKMKVKNNDTIVLMIDLIENICSSQFYSSEKNFLKVYSALNIMLSILESIVSNSEIVCNSINGELRGQKIQDGDKFYTEP